jgi:mono/diheme cytochrome c family protein
MERISKLGVLVLAIVFAAAGCSKSSQSSSSQATSAASTESAASPSESAMASPASSGPMTAASGAMANSGGKVFTTDCASCHQANGEGVPGTFPPLAGNPVVVGSATHVIHIVKYGLSGQIQAEGKSYNGMMPAWGQQLSNADIAAAITYIRSSWGNHASAVTESEVAGVSQ